MVDTTANIVFYLEKYSTYVECWRLIDNNSIMNSIIIIYYLETFVRRHDSELNTCLKAQTT